MEQDKREITPIRMGQLTDVAGKVIKVMATNTWHLTFDEMEIILDLVRYGMNETRKRNGENGQKGE